MGHTNTPDRTYQLLQQRLDKNVTGAPDSPSFTQILKLLYSPEEAEMALRIPSKPTPLKVLSQRLMMPEEPLREKLTEMARRGIIVDLSWMKKPYYLLPPIVVGFFEFTFMRARPDMPLAELAKLFDAYMYENDKFAHAVFDGKTQIGRTMAHESTLPTDDHSEILDWERATHVIKKAKTVGLSLCQCRHKAKHLGKACDAPERNCIALNNGAKTLIHSGIIDEISNEEALDILEEAREAHLVQVADNVQRNVSFICNCCGCCCGMLTAMQTFNMPNAVVTSNYIMQVEEDACKGCTKCEKVCPIGAIQMVEVDDPEREAAGKKKRKIAVRDEELCIGCGVCVPVCKFEALSMKARPQRIRTPENVFDRVATMAIERGKLGNLIFDDPDKLSHRALGRILSLIEKMPPYKALMAIEPLKSKFLKTMLGR